MRSQQGWRGLSGSSPIPLTTNLGFYSQIDSSTPIVNDNTKKSLIGLGLGTLSVPAYSFYKGNSFVAKIGGIISSLNNTDIRITIESFGNILIDTGDFKLKTSNNNFWQLEVNFTIREIGISGVASIVSNCLFTQIRNNLAVEVFGFNTINNTTFDTTILNTLEINAQWQIASLSNSIHSEYFCLNNIF
jgi:hypothetical protein